MWCVHNAIVTKLCTHQPSRPPSPGPWQPRSASRLRSPVLERSIPTKAHDTQRFVPAFFPSTPCFGGVSTLERVSVPRSSSWLSNVPSHGLLRTLSGRPSAGPVCLPGSCQALPLWEGGERVPGTAPGRRNPLSLVTGVRRRSGRVGSWPSVQLWGLCSPRGARLASDECQLDERRRSPWDCRQGPEL